MEDFWDFKPVFILTDKPGLDAALALRTGLEVIGLRTYLAECKGPEHVDALLSGELPNCDHLILCCHGDERKIYLGVYPELWLGPEEIRRKVLLPGKLVMTVGCDTGVPENAAAFLDAGCRTFIGPDGWPRQDAVLLFPLMFYRNLTGHIDSHDPRLTERESFEKARASVPGAHIFGMHGQ